MTQHIHFYTLAGRGIQSLPLTDRTILRTDDRTLAARIQYKLMSSGYTLTRWHEDEQAGLAKSHSEEFILRVKSDGLVRDMKPIGAAGVVAEIRRAGVDVDPFTGGAAMQAEQTPAEAAPQTPEQDMDAFAYAVWMVGNTDTPEDKVAWWKDFQAVWESAAKRVEAMHERGVQVGAGFEATGLKAPAAD